MPTISTVIQDALRDSNTIEDRLTRKQVLPLSAKQKTKIIDFFDHSVSDKIIDRPKILAKAVDEMIYGNFDQLSMECGTGELALHFYTEIKCRKFHTVYEDGIGISTLFIVLALVENEIQKMHYRKRKLKSNILNKNYFQSKSHTTFYINIRDTDPHYLQNVQKVITRINRRKHIKVIYIGEEEFKNYKFMTTILKKCDFLNLDNGNGSEKYWPKIFDYCGVDKVICLHHLGVFFPIFNRKLNEANLAKREYAVITYPIIEPNKWYQNGCLKIALLNNRMGPLRGFLKQRITNLVRESKRQV